MTRKTIEDLFVDQVRRDIPPSSESGFYRGLFEGTRIGAAAVRATRPLLIIASILVILTMTASVCAVDARNDLSRLQATGFDAALEVLRSDMDPSHRSIAVEQARRAIASAIQQLRRSRDGFDDKHAANALRWIAEHSNR